MSSVARIISDCRDGRKIARGVTSVTGSATNIATGLSQVEDVLVSIKRLTAPALEEEPVRSSFVPSTTAQSPTVGRSSSWLIVARSAPESVAVTKPDRTTSRHAPRPAEVILPISVPLGRSTPTTLRYRSSP